MSKEEAESSGGSRSREIVERDFAEEPTTTGSVNEKTDPIDEEKIIGDSGKVGQDGVEKTSVYDRFSKRRKNLITAIVSFNCLLSRMSSHFSLFLISPRFSLLLLSDMLNVNSYDCINIPSLHSPNLFRLEYDTDNNKYHSSDFYCIYGNISTYLVSFVRILWS